MELRTPLGRVRGLGSAKDGSGHWWAQRLTAVALVPLSIWFVVSALSLIGADYTVFRAWAASHGNAMLLILFTVVMFQHTYLGIQVVIEDYIQGEAVKTVSLVVTRFVAVIAAVSCIMAVLRLAFGN